MATGNRLIGLDKIKPMDFPSYEMDGLDVVRYLETLPTVDAVEAVHGRWVQGDMYDYGDVCSVCDWDSAREPCKLRYCPNCGAKMDGGINK